MYVIEYYGNGFIVADYSGKRGRHGAAYAGLDGAWHDQPTDIKEFPDEASARAFAQDQIHQLKNQSKTNAKYIRT